MAKAGPIPGIGEDDPFALVAARVVRVRARELVEHPAGVLDTADIEPLHDMRVATRRLRAALEVFAPCFPKKRLRAALAEVKALADALGERRDRDVALAALDRYLGQVGEPDRPGVRSLAAVLREEQADANRSLAPMVAPERIAALDERLAELVAAADSGLAERQPETARAPAAAAAATAGAEAGRRTAPTNGGDPR